mmetsp:Transcript_39944/g.63929  ORF Transcript_39944/g.63929 Transcript_39944/m.63929 type:complete len:269 (-) Transcript_39944:360-1166(-)
MKLMHTYTYTQIYDTTQSIFRSSPRSILTERSICKSIGVILDPLRGDCAVSTTETCYHRLLVIIRIIAGILWCIRNCRNHRRYRLLKTCHHRYTGIGCAICLHLCLSITTMTIHLIIGHDTGKGAVARVLLLSWHRVRVHVHVGLHAVHRHGLHALDLRRLHVVALSSIATVDRGHVVLRLHLDHIGLVLLGVVFAIAYSLGDHNGDHTAHAYHAQRGGHHDQFQWAERSKQRGQSSLLRFCLWRHVHCTFVFILIVFVYRFAVFLSW